MVVNLPQRATWLLNLLRKAGLRNPSVCTTSSADVSDAVHSAGLKKKLKDLMGEFSELRARIHEENRQVVERRVYTVTGQHLPEEEIDHMIETGGW
jgi:syntaxin 1B/2/3